ncbi:adenine nucleotide alpha hydrolase [Terrihalobacillus insolitus]|uniref:adenine nucleotide alpha hydrolase n=1 Tax=Terrihalobacillus insolitus TaxID=2950438 RepID=UPI002340020E|nr:adenine nucleotide alpha hydrolase [Terrihalobacillus insolitus]MDC3414394.1 adenine nucleotide alpha hydrolase [Terrihalobacillus insolitus]
MTKTKIVVSFSGKDSTLALHDLMHSDEFEVDSLMATVTSGFDRTSIHGVREELLVAQANSIGLPLRIVRIPQKCSNEIYNEIMAEAMSKMKADGINHIAFGDLFLEDIRNYRENMLKPTGVTPLFPLWGFNTDELLHRFLSLGYKTVITCVDLTKLSEEFSGKIIENGFMDQLPKEVDPCGEYGEYHSFVFEGPIFKSTINFTLGEKKVTPDMFTGKDRFCYTDLIPD